MTRKIAYFIGAVAIAATVLLAYMKHFRLAESLILTVCEAIVVFLAAGQLPESASPFRHTRSGALQSAGNSDAEKLRLIGGQIQQIRGSKSPYMIACLDHLLHQTELAIRQMVEGTLTIDLAPGGNFFRLSIDRCKKRYWAVSFVDPEQYWHSAKGVEILTRNGEAIRNRGIEIERIFVLPRSELAVLKPFLAEHMEAGVKCFVTVREGTDRTWRRDFALMDAGEMAEEFVLNPEGWDKLLYYFQGPITSQEQIDQLKTAWKGLKGLSQTAEEFLKSQTTI